MEPILFNIRGVDIQAHDIISQFSTVILFLNDFFLPFLISSPPIPRYRCKMLKRASLGRMCTAVKKLGPTLKYLEEVRQHLGRLPSINPSTRTIIMTGEENDNVILM
jgi:hypothetical protein